MLKDVRENRMPLKELRIFASDDHQHQSGIECISESMKIMKL